MWKLQNILAVPAAYRVFTRLVGGSAREDYVRQYVQPAAGQRVLDVGCGPGDVLAHLPAVDYYGIDIDPNYIGAAQKRYGARGTFRCEDVADLVVREAGSFDLVLATGLLHHLDDDRARHLLHVAARALKPSGRLATLDGGFVPGQARLARLLLRLDRGKHVRTPETYTALAAEVFPAVRCDVRHDLMRIPYTHVILTCGTAATVERHAA
jgi:SAM-dependent methyltransferase